MLLFMNVVPNWPHASDHGRPCSFQYVVGHHEDTFVANMSLGVLDLILVSAT